MQIDRKLNLVVPVDLGTVSGYVHAMPISREVWETYFLILAKTYAAILSEGLTVISGPPIARMLLKRVAQMSGVWEGQEGVERGLLPEIRRLCNIVMPTGQGWETLPFEAALQRNLIDADALAEAEGAIIFFICASAVLRGPQARAKLMILLNGLQSLWGASTTSSDVTAFAASLPTSTPAENTGAKATASSIPH